MDRIRNRGGVISLAWWSSVSKTSAHEESLDLPWLNIPAQLLGKAFGIGGGIESLEFQPGGCLMMTVVVVGNGVVGDDHIGPKLSDLQDHSPQSFFVAPEAKRFVGGFRIAKILEAEEVWLRALDLSGGSCLARANRPQFFVKLRPDCVLTPFAKGREHADRMCAVFSPHNDQRGSILVIRMRGDAHHRPWVCEVEQRLVEVDAIFICGLSRRRRGCLLRVRYAQKNCEAQQCQQKF